MYRVRIGYFEVRVQVRRNIGITSQVCSVETKEQGGPRSGSVHAENFLEICIQVVD